jgi:2-haloalkanoic acid dehalogenase type II
MPLKAVLFDLGLTLIKTISFPEIYRRILAKFEIEVSVEDIVEVQKETEAEFDMSAYDEKRRKEFWTRYNDVLLKKLGVEVNRLFIASQIDNLWWSFSYVQVFPDAKPTLTMLKEKGLKIGLVSNGFKQDIDHVLDKLDLEEWFDEVVCIDSCNCSKPDKQIFLYALDKLGIQPSEAIFVGDSVLQDYVGASRVGIKPYLIDREKKLPNNYDTIKNLTELLTKI